MSSATDSSADAPATPQLPLHMRRNGFDPVPDLAAVREGSGLAQVRTPFGADAWLVTRHADVRALLGDAQSFSNVWKRPDHGLSEQEAAEMRRGNLLAYDPPEHTRLRRMLTPEFTVRRMRRLQPRIEEIVEEHLDAMERAGAPRDLVADFALPVPSLVICELLGVPYEDRAEFQERTGKALDTSLPEEERLRLNVEQRAYMRELVERAQADPGEDMLGMLVREHGDDLETPDLTGIASLLLVAGHETTSNMLGLGTLALLRHPDQLALVRDEPERVAPAVEELMRWLSIVHSGAPRVTTTDVEIAGQVVPAGSIVVFALPAANRDPELVDDPEKLDVTRKQTNHIGFGHGVHHCVGAPLARMEMCTAFPALLRRFPNLRTATPDDEGEFRSYHFVYGLKRLDVAW
ncbi:cytochrome P450 [Saccharopolyspora sp. NPDC002578]